MIFFHLFFNLLNQFTGEIYDKKQILTEIVKNFLIFCMKIISTIFLIINSIKIFVKITIEYFSAKNFSGKIVMSY